MAGPPMTPAFLDAFDQASACDKTSRGTRDGRSARTLGDWNACAVPMQNEPA